MVTNIDASSEYCNVDCKAWYHFDDLELVELAQPENPHMITYTMTVPKDMYPFKPYSKVVYKKNSNNKWSLGIFIVKHRLATFPYVVYLTDDEEETDYDTFRECNPFTTHSHLLGTTYPADTPACKECGKAEPDCVCNKNKSIDTTKDNVTQPKLQPFQRVLARNKDHKSVWMCEIFSHIELVGEQIFFQCVSNSYHQCIPYKGNEHLLGTCDEPKN